MAAQQDAEVLFSAREKAGPDPKAVLDPKAPNWKKVLAEVWQAIDKFTEDPDARKMRLPQLKGTGSRKKSWGNW